MLLNAERTAAMEEILREASTSRKSMLKPLADRSDFWAYMRVMERGGNLVVLFMYLLPPFLFFFFLFFKKKKKFLKKKKKLNIKLFLDNIWK